jgi:hypothetical protein
MKQHNRYHKPCAAWIDIRIVFQSAGKQLPKTERYFGTDFYTLDRRLNQ